MLDSRVLRRIFGSKTEKVTLVKYSRSSLIRTNWELGYVRISEFSDKPGFTKYTEGGGGIRDFRALSSEGEEADDVDIRQCILADDCDVGHQMYTDNDIVSFVLSEKSC
jgi:hypothetical protein